LNEFEALLSFLGHSTTFKLSLQDERNKNVHLELLQDRRHNFSRNLEKPLNGSYTKLSDLAIPLAH